MYGDNKGSKDQYMYTFNEWLDIPLGKYILNLEHIMVGNIAARKFGMHALVLGEYKFLECLEQSCITSKVLCNMEYKPNKTHLSIQTRLDKLPIDTDSMDLILMAHVIEMDKNPHEVLREAYRVLRPEGELLLMAFNPFSLWGFWRQFAKYAGHMPWRSRFYSRGKLEDWLALLGFDIMRVTYLGYCLPLSFGKRNKFKYFVEKISQKINIPVGAVYIIRAKKRVEGMTPLAAELSEELRVEDLAEPNASS